uniref:RING-type domain-containing protein n=1 Tax=Eutreptiella gymnastica TaxID=73025 RepID=A0A7S1N503_9EUGL|mmetsp:Transcript_120342/g.209530  ORF Transcript_120342/g.209530 Transcript_120342/m.209530 type:complete len:507 (+) Transcript_120342:86-1606(+)
MGNSHRKERRHGAGTGSEATTGGGARQGHVRRGGPAADRGTSSDATTGGARQRSSTQPVRQQRRAASPSRAPPQRPAVQRYTPGTNSSGTAAPRPAAAPQWVMPHNYQQQQPVTGADLQESVSIKNHANLNKQTLSLVPARDGRFRIRFQADCRLEAEVRIYLATRELPNPGDAGVRFEPQHPRFANAVLPPHKLPAENNCTYTSPSINVRNYWKYLKYRLHQPHDYPVVISMTYAIPDADWAVIQEGIKDKEKKEDKDKEEDNEKAPERREQSQFTYAEVVRTAHEDKPTEYNLKVLKQRLQIGNDLYDLEDIYGMPADDKTQNVDGDQPVTGTLAGVTDGTDDLDEGEECVICLAAPRTTLVMPCRHMCLCSECAGMLRQRTNKCPICRTVAERFLTLKKENKDGEKKESDSESDDEKVDFTEKPPEPTVGGSRTRSASAAPIATTSGSTVDPDRERQKRSPNPGNRNGPSASNSGVSGSRPSRHQRTQSGTASRTVNREIERY